MGRWCRREKDDLQGVDGAQEAKKGEKVQEQYW